MDEPVSVRAIYPPATIRCSIVLSVIIVQILHMDDKIIMLRVDAENMGESRIRSDAGIYVQGSVGIY